MKTITKYKHLSPRTPEQRYQYAILEQLCNISDTLKELTKENKTTEKTTEEEPKKTTRKKSSKNKEVK